MKPVLYYIVARLKEPSTYAGLATLLAAYHISAEQSAAIVAGFMAAGGLVAAFFPDPGSK